MPSSTDACTFHFFPELPDNHRDIHKNTFGTNDSKVRTVSQSDQWFVRIPFGKHIVNFSGGLSWWRECEFLGVVFDVYHIHDNPICQILRLDVKETDLKLLPDHCICLFAEQRN